MVDSNNVGEIPADVFGRFIENLRKEELSEDTIARLERVLLEEPNLTEDALKKAIFPEEEQ